MDGVFSKRHTLVVKGIAVLILCWHHLYWHNVNVPINLQTAEAYDVLVPLTKVCVALFTILSGFGINESFKHSEHTYIQFSFKHIKKLLFNFWWVYVPVFVLSFWFHSSGTPLKIYSAGTSFLKALWNFFMDFYGIRAFIYSPTLNNTWWYIEAVLVFYICFPVFHFM